MTVIDKTVIDKFKKVEELKYEADSPVESLISKLLIRGGLIESARKIEAAIKFS